MARYIRLLGASLGVLIAIVLAPDIDAFGDQPNAIIFMAVWVLAWGVVGFVTLPSLTVYPAAAILRAVHELSPGEFVAAVIGLLIGLFMGLLLGLPLSALQEPFGRLLPIGVSVVLGLGMLGATVAKRHDLLAAAEALGLLPRARGERGGRGERIFVDTSAIIDGRLADIVGSGFLHGELVVPRFVLEELQRIADSPDTLRRNRGRRGLEILSSLQKGPVPVEVTDADVPGVTEVDGKLVALARAARGAILTTDFNLNRVADLQGIRVLNVNSLANAMKPAFLPGDELRVKVIQEGKEPGQGVAFLDDGTMIVVESGSRFLDRELDVLVTRVLQTVAGRMVFAQPRLE
ncbi:MAG TPA: PIN domain-containing protein [Candidatus Limnocylindrales bacterium]|nr:PIN domain-containing protein [Candidatus Limnocylindrales bacterium]